MDTYNESVIYKTGCTEAHRLLVGGVWTLWSQEGFPIEMSHLISRDNGWLIDWLEAMADASRTDNLPSLMQQIESFLPGSVIAHLKAGFVREGLGRGKTYEQIVREKRSNGSALHQFIVEAVGRI